MFSKQPGLTVTFMPLLLVFLPMRSSLIQILTHAEPLTHQPITIHIVLHQQGLTCTRMTPHEAIKQMNDTCRMPGRQGHVELTTRNITSLEPRVESMPCIGILTSSLNVGIHRTTEGKHVEIVLRPMRGLQVLKHSHIMTTLIQHQLIIITEMPPVTIALAELILHIMTFHIRGRIISKGLTITLIPGKQLLSFLPTVNKTRLELLRKNTHTLNSLKVTRGEKMIHVPWRSITRSVVDRSDEP